jgi:hypothetical protein
VQDFAEPTLSVNLNVQRYHELNANVIATR